MQYVQEDDILLPLYVAQQIDQEAFVNAYYRSFRPDLQLPRLRDLSPQTKDNTFFIPYPNLNDAESNPRDPFIYTEEEDWTVPLWVILLNVHQTLADPVCEHCLIYDTRSRTLGLWLKS
ncbi:uncharacterized protein ATNIH1004_006857 [Aspergillus tanneri]|uniref:Uncharacterized protein n=1 Tax=Aspergillus tanneri TaxID=1220188 RepID=A0A5M9MEN2_9EURO|nr:uncharacterized protein ATNIH1004_006857 [Aspergillus tanneri]KAA8645438.1 hypothetical protein ATNIH1004_006857 [Aspergillus tanneri]